MPAIEINNPTAPQYPRDRVGEDITDGNNNPVFGSSNPGQTTRPIRETVDRAPDQTAAAATPRDGGTGAWTPNVDISENSREWCIEADLPGVHAEDVRVHIHEGNLIIAALARSEAEEETQRADSTVSDRRYYRRERRCGYFEKVIALPANADRDQVRCELDNGVLCCRIAKTESEEPEEARTIPVRTRTAPETAVEAAPDPVQSVVPSGIPRGNITGGAGCPPDELSACAKTATLNSADAERPAEVVSPGEPLS